MLKRLYNVSEYMYFINEINQDKNFSEPMLASAEQFKINLKDAGKNESNYILGVFEGKTMIGLFVFCILEDERYIEMTVGLSKNRKAYDEMMSFIKKEYKGYKVDMVYNPNNHILKDVLEKENAIFYPEQLKLILKNEVAYNTDVQVELYSPQYREQYVGMHSTGVYWTADKVIEASDIFHIILAIEGEEVVGYMDITHVNDENELYDILVKSEYRRKGFGKAMLAKAIELNRPKNMMVLVDVDNVAAIALFESLGFEKSMGENSITANMIL